MLEINLSCLQSNVERILQGKRKLIAVVKNNAYGCGSVAISSHLLKMGIDYLFVNDLREALPLLKAGIMVPILVHNSMQKDDFFILQKHPNLVVTINNLQDAINIHAYATNQAIRVHLQVDTKMNRLGIKGLETFNKIMELLRSNPNIVIEGIYTHFTDPISVDEQVAKFKHFAESYPFPMVHCAASGTYQLTEYGNYVRIGLALYDVNQVMQVKTKPLEIRDVAKGETIGYFGTYQAKQDMRIAVLPVGYGNGYRRALEGFYTICSQKKYPIVGRICMNHMFVEVDASIDINSVFELTSPNLPAKELAKYTNCSNYEIYTMFIFEQSILTW